MPGENLWRKPGPTQNGRAIEGEAIFETHFAILNRFSVNIRTNLHQDRFDTNGKNCLGGEKGGFEIEKNI
ncbi:hypothetical protein TNCV_4752841 [Trichonephila clavipes]|nr:hypothetical protein TNCV_4752841 [Trichonephila clavipes]